MAETLAIIDTDVAVLLLDTSKSPENATRTRIERARQAIVDVRRKGARCLITTPTVVELASWPAAPSVVRARLMRLIDGLRSCGLTIGSAESAGAILLKKLRARPPGMSKTEIKFDALIAGIAHAHEARWLITGNAKDLRPLLAQIDSKVEIVDIDSVPPPELRSQLTLAEQGLKKT